MKKLIAILTVILYQPLLGMQHSPHTIDIKEGPGTDFSSAKFAHSLAHTLQSMDPLIHAIMFGKLEDQNRRSLIRRLVDQRENIDYEKNDLVDGACTPLSVALDRCDDETVQLLLSRGASAQRKVGHRTPLGIAARHGNSFLIELLIKHGAQVDERSKVFSIDKSEATPLYIAASFGHQEAMQKLIARGAHRERALAFSIVLINPRACKALLNSGANPHKRYGERNLNAFDYWQRVANQEQSPVREQLETMFELKTTQEKIAQIKSMLEQKHT